ncbi:MAG: glycosyltransferase family A protein [Cyclobacteriaceae bacterium]
MTDSPFFVMIATAGKDTELSETLASLAKCTQPTNYQYTIVIENGTKYAAEAITKKYGTQLRTRYYYFPRGNKSAALNFGLAQMNDTDGLIFFLDDDVHVEKGTLLAYEQACHGKHTGYYFGGPTQASYKVTPPDWFRQLLPASAQGWSPNGDDDYLITPRFLGFNWAAFSADIKKLGGFNENLGPGTKPKRTGQEWDMQHKMLNADFQAVYVEQAIVRHFVPQERSTFSWLMKRRFQGGFGTGISYLEQQGKNKFPIQLIRYFAKYNLLLPVRLLSFSKQKATLGIGDFLAGWGRIIGYCYARLS